MSLFLMTTWPMLALKLTVEWCPACLASDRITSDQDAGLLQLWLQNKALASISNRFPVINARNHEPSVK
jgi:hypothetical protein